MGANLRPVQLVPPGFTGLLALKQLGRLPDELVGSYQGVIELRDWFMEARREDEESLFGASGNPVQTANLVTGTGASFQNFAVGGVSTTVPAGQLWYVEQYSGIAFNVISGDVVSWAMAIQSPNEAMPLVVSPQVNDSGVARTHWTAVNSTRAFWATPGTIFGIALVDILSAAGRVVRLSMRATRLPI